MLTIPGNNGHPKRKGRGCDDGILCFDPIPLSPKLSIQIGPMKCLISTKGQDLDGTEKGFNLSQFPGGLVGQDGPEHQFPDRDRGDGH